MIRRCRPIVVAILAASLTATSAGHVLAQAREGDPEDQPTLSGRIEAAISRRALELGGEPAAILEFVRTNVRPEPYDGVFKGALGAYLTGGGNSADQALLVDALVRGAADAPATRFARCELDETAGATLAAEWVASEQPTLDLGRVVAAAADLEYAPVREALNEARATYESIQAEAASQAPLLAAELEAAGWSGADGRPFEAPRSHVWLQLEDAGEWIDLDPTAVDGEAHCAPAETFEALPDELDHRLTLRAIAERLSDGILEETTILETTVPTADIAAARMAFVFGEAVGELDAPRPWGEPWRYTPLLRIDNEDVTGDAVELPGAGGVTGGLLSDAADALGGLDRAEDTDGEGGGGLLGGLGGDDAEAEPAAAGAAQDEITAVWLEFEHRTPAGETTRVRSEFFDRIGPAARNGSAASLEVPALEVLDGEYPLLQQIWQVGILAGPVAAIEGGIDLDGVLLTSFDGLSGQLDAVLRTFPSMQPQRSIRPGEPTILLLGLQLRPDTSGEAATLATVLDAVHVPGSAPADPTEAARQALAITAAEEMLLRTVADAPDPLSTVAQVFAQARSEAIPLVAITSSDQLGSVQASEDALARLQRRVSEGSIVLVPASTPDVEGRSATGWYTIDPSTGVVRDQHESGRHAAAEDAPLRQRAAQFAQRTYDTACRVARPFVLATSVLFVAAMPANGGNALRAQLATRAEQQRLLDETVSAACSQAGTPGAGG